MAPSGAAVAASVAVSAAAAGSALLLAAVDPNQPGHYPLCPFLATTGPHCPDAVPRAVHGPAARRPGGALAALAVPVLVLALGGLAAGATDGAGAVPHQPATGVVWGLLGVVLAFWLLRNLPGVAWLSPA